MVWARNYVSTTPWRMSSEERRFVLTSKTTEQLHARLVARSYSSCLFVNVTPMDYSSFGPVNTFPQTEVVPCSLPTLVWNSLHGTGVMCIRLKTCGSCGVHPRKANNTKFIQAALLAYKVLTKYGICPNHSLTSICINVKYAILHTTPRNLSC